MAEAATETGHKIGEKVEQAADWAKEKAHQVGHRVAEATQKVEHKAKEVFSNTSDIREHMAVFASCGTKVGTVDHVEGDSIKLTKTDSPEGQHHRIPLSWVNSVSDAVHLDRDHEKVQRGWQPA
jgi:hypothetical protein